MKHSQHSWTGNLGIGWERCGRSAVQGRESQNKPSLAKHLSQMPVFPQRHQESLGCKGAAPSAHMSAPVWSVQNKTSGKGHAMLDYLLKGTWGREGSRSHFMK